MLVSLNSLRGHSLSATDGPIGSIKDAYFDDQQWGIRYLVVGTGDWLSGRDVLISPRSISTPPGAGAFFAVSLSREQVENSPDVDFERPIPRRFEEDYYRYYGWSPYWVGFPLELYPTVLLGAEMPVPMQPSKKPELPPDEDVVPPDERSHLRSAREIEGYHLHATDGDLGHLEDYLFDSETWQVDSIVVNTKNWWPGKKVLVSTRSFERIDWYNRLARVTLTRAEIKNSPTYDPASSTSGTPLRS